MIIIVLKSHQRKAAGRGHKVFWYTGWLKMCCYRSRLVFNCCFKDTHISQGSV